MVTVFLIQRDRSLQHFRGTVEIAGEVLHKPQIRKGGGEPLLIVDLTGEVGALLKQGAGGVQVTSVTTGDAEAV